MQLAGAKGEIRGVSASRGRPGALGMWVAFLAGPAILVGGMRFFGVLNDYIYQILMVMGINVILCASLNLVNGFCGQFSIGHAGFMGLGAYASAVLTSRAASWPFFPATLAGGLVSAAVAYVIGIPSFRTRGDYLAVITLAFNMIIVNLFQNSNYLGGPRGFPGIMRYTDFTWIWLWVGITVLVLRNCVFSAHGRAIMAVRENEAAAELGGVDTQKYKLLAFSMASFFAGVAGALSAHLLEFIAPQLFNVFKSFDVLVMLYLGGVGSISGSLLGAALWTGMLEILRPLGVWRLVVGPILLVILMIWRSRGLFGDLEFGFIVRGLGEVETDGAPGD